MNVFNMRKVAERDREGVRLDLKPRIELLQNEKFKSSVSLPQGSVVTGTVAKPTGFISTSE